MTSRNKTSISFSRCRKRLSGQTLYNIIPQRLRANEFHVIPEGGSIAPGTLGYVFAMEEVCRQMKTLHVEFDHVISTVCSSGKMAGMLLGKSVYNMKAQIYGINVCDDAPYFQERISNIIREARRKCNPSVTGGRTSAFPEEKGLPRIIAPRGCDSECYDVFNEKSS